MAVRFAEGFDINYGDLLLVFTGKSGFDFGSVDGRVGKAISGYNSPRLWKILDSRSYWTWGFAVNHSTAVSDVFAYILNSGGSGWTVSFDAARKVSITNTAQTVTTDYVANPGAWFYLEIEIYVHATAGYVRLYINGALDSEVTDVDTRTGGLETLNRFDFYRGLGLTPCAFDDAYIVDNQSPGPTAPLGDVAIRPAQPFANGDVNDFGATGAGSNFEAVDEVNQDGDTSYNSSMLLNGIDLYQFDPVSFTGDVRAVVFNAIVKKLSPGTSRTLAPICRSGETDDVGSDLSLGTDWSLLQKVYNVDPGTGEAWTEEGLNAAQFGVKITS